MTIDFFPRQISYVSTLYMMGPLDVVTSLT